MNKDDQLMLSRWLAELIPIVDKVCDTAIKEEVDEKFWREIYKYERGSGSPFVSGWITKFLPYLSSGRNYFYSTEISTKELPLQISKVPFIWSYYGKEFRMEFYGGFLGSKYDPVDNSIKPVHFWSVAYDKISVVIDDEL